METVEHYLQLMEELDLTLVKALDTHVHADHISGLDKLRDREGCITVMEAVADVDFVSMHAEEGDVIDVDAVSIDVTLTFWPYA